MWILSTAAGRVRGLGSGYSDIFPVSHERLRAEGLMLFAIDIVTSTTDSFAGIVRGAWDGRLELVLRADEDVPIRARHSRTPGLALASR